MWRARTIWNGVVICGTHFRAVDAHRISKNEDNDTFTIRMALRTNKQILTGGEKYRQDKDKKHGVDEVVFDKLARQEFLTGFHKRKVERQKKAQAYHKEQERLAKIEERKEAKANKQREIDERLRQLQELREHLKLSMEEDDDKSDKKSGAKKSKHKEPQEGGDASNGSSDDEWTGFGDEEGATLDSHEDEPKKGILLRKQVYEIDDKNSLGDAVVDGTTEVMVESLDNPYTANLRSQSLEALAKANNVNLEKADEVLEDSVKRAKDYAVLCGVAKPKPKPKAKKKKFRYLTKGERRENERKQKLSKLKSRRRE